MARKNLVFNEKYLFIYLLVEFLLHNITIFAFVFTFGKDVVSSR